MSFGIKNNPAFSDNYNAMIYGVMSDNSISSLGFALKVPAGEKAALPVAPSSVIYSHFKHVTGVPAAEGVHGVTISKLNILDALIEQMNRINKPAFRPDAGTPEDRLDAMIDSYYSQILKAGETDAAPYAQAAEKGVLFSLTV